MLSALLGFLLSLSLSLSPFSRGKGREARDMYFLRAGPSPDPADKARAAAVASSYLCLGTKGLTSRVGYPDKPVRLRDGGLPFVHANLLLSGASLYSKEACLCCVFPVKHF